MILKWFFSQIMQILIVAIFGFMAIQLTIGWDTFLGMFQMAREGLQMIQDMQNQLGNFDINSIMSY